MRHALLAAFASPALFAMEAMAQTPAPVAEPSLGDRLGGWLPFLVVLLVAIGIYQYRKRRTY